MLSLKDIVKLEKLEFKEIFKEVKSFQDVQDCYNNNFFVLHEAASVREPIPEKFLTRRCLSLRKRPREQKQETSIRCLLREMIFWSHPQLKGIPLEWYFNDRKGEKNGNDLWSATTNSTPREYRGKIFKWFSAKECSKNLDKLEQMGETFANEGGNKLIRSLINRGKEYREIKGNKEIE